jgi:hypothetical protein
VESHHDLISLFKHDLFGEPVPTFSGSCLSHTSVIKAETPVVSPAQRRRAGEIYLTTPRYFGIE